MLHQFLARDCSAGSIPTLVGRGLAHRFAQSEGGESFGTGVPLKFGSHSGSWLVYRQWGQVNGFSEVPLSDSVQANALIEDELGPAPRISTARRSIRTMGENRVTSHLATVRPELKTHFTLPQ